MQNEPTGHDDRTDASLRGSRSPMDVTTLQEVERLLTSTEFASADDLIAQGGAVEVPAIERTVSESVEAEDATPLPKRR